MPQTVVLEELVETFREDTGEITSHQLKTIRKGALVPTDEFVKVSKYLNVIFSYNSIPLNLVPISLIFAQRMEFKTNLLYLLKADKQEIAEMLGVKTNTVEKLISQCKDYQILKPAGSRGRYEVNGFLFSTGSVAETRALQAHFDFDSDTVVATAEQKSAVTGESVRKAIMNKEKSYIPGQMRIEGI